MTYLEVAVAAPVHHTLTYAPPPVKTVELVPGLRLLVPLGSQLVTGYLLGFIDRPLPESTGIKIKPVAEILDESPCFPANMVPFFRWMAEYYCHPLGEVIKTALPGGLTARSGRRVVLTDEGRKKLPGIGRDEYGFLVDLLLEKGELAPATTRRLWRGSEQKKLVEWEKKGWLLISREIVGATAGAKTETFVVLAAAEQKAGPEKGGDREQQQRLKPSEKKTMALLGRLLAGADLQGEIAVPRRLLTGEYPGARPALRSLAEKGLVTLEERRVYRDPFGESLPFMPAPEKLTAEQQAAIDKLVPAIRKKSFAPFLLHGVTGSGKTEVYLRAAAATLDTGRSVLVLVPEIALATQMEGYFLSRFGSRTALIHSGLSPGERYDQWQRLNRGEATVVLGARSAVFAPLHDPGLIVVDEEHDNAYKQEDGLRYNARDLAVLRASMNNAVVLLGSASPSVTSYYNARQNKYRLLNLTKRIEDRPLPEVRVIDLRSIKTVSGRPPLFANEMVSALRGNLERSEQSLVFLNRRGYANMMICRQCGQTVQCRNCHVSLTLHQGRGELLCHYCGHSVKSAALACPNCQSTKLAGLGFGTERLEQELAKLFPRARIARLDRDTARKRKDYLAILRAMHRREIDILIGTQLITKGYHFPQVTLVGIVCADVGLGLPDFRAGERTFQLILQVTGRAGRGDKPGRVIIQTHQPEHYSITMAREHDFTSLFNRELANRKKLGFPPFARLINLRIEGAIEDEVISAAQELQQAARESCLPGQRISVLGPAPAPLEKLRGRYRWQILLQSRDIEALHVLCAQLLKRRVRAKGGAVVVSIDVDPENMM